MKLLPGDLVKFQQIASVRELPYHVWLNENSNGRIRRHNVGKSDVDVYLVISSSLVVDRDPSTLRDVEFSFLHPRYGVLWWWVNERGVERVR